MAHLSNILLTLLYIGEFLLIAGTVLGGIWAAQSWGRFWDWDPKEAWAFISAAVYALIIHAYRFNYIASFGLASGAVLGLVSILFTWYGVNFVLGTGLHSYGFGNGSGWYFFFYAAAELVFLGTIFTLAAKKREIV